MSAANQKAGPADPVWIRGSDVALNAIIPGTVNVAVPGGVAINGQPIGVNVQNSPTVTVGGQPIGVNVQNTPNVAIPGGVAITGTPNVAIPGVVSIYDPQFSANYFGLINGKVAKLRLVMGSRALGWNSITTYGDCCGYLDTTQDLMNTPTVGQTLYVVSTNALDTLLGTGAQKVAIVYLDAPGDEQHVTVNLAGTTPVSLGAGFTAIQWMVVKALGTGVAAAGTISITSTNGVATVATTFEAIQPNKNRSTSTRYKVPAGYSAFGLNFIAASDGTAVQDVRLRAPVSFYDRTLDTVFTHQSRIFLPGGGDRDVKDLYYLKFPALTTIKVASLPSASGAGNKLEAAFKLLLIAN